jgi:hypothetical protein
MGNIKNIVIVSFVCISNAYSSNSYSSKDYLFKFHTELPLHYRAEIFLLDVRYKKAMSSPSENEPNEFAEIFERMEQVLSRISSYASAQTDYKAAVTAYRNKVPALTVKEKSENLS